MVLRYVDHTQHGQVVFGQHGQINYGPTADLTAADVASLSARYGVKQHGQHAGIPHAARRLSQYSRTHATYVRAAHVTGRHLTIQEHDAATNNRQAQNASINHVLASGTGQNILNHETLRFASGTARVNAHVGAALAAPIFAPPGPAQRQVLFGLAEQAAAAARVQGYSRSMVRERAGERLPYTGTNRRIYGAGQIGAGNALDVGQTRNRALQHTLTAFQGATAPQRYRAYRDVLRMTFDSPGNLRVGDDYGNNQVSTGVDLPMTAAGGATARAHRLWHAHQTFAPARLLTPQRTFTRDSHDRILSSSRHPAVVLRGDPTPKSTGGESPTKRARTSTTPTQKGARRGSDLVPVAPAAKRSRPLKTTA